MSDKTSEFGQHIVHIDELKPLELLAFLKQWNIDRPTITVTEKIDGSFMIFGEDSQGLFLRAKGSEWRQEEQLEDFFLKDARKFFTQIKTIPVISAVVRALDLSTRPSNVRIHGEAILSWDHNVVLYDKAKIGERGAFVIFSVEVDGRETTSRLELETVARELDDLSSIKFYGNPHVDLSSYSIPDGLVLSLEALLTKHEDILSKPARTSTQKEIKEKVSGLIRSIGNKVKSDMLAVPYTSRLGGDPEGYVVHLPDGSKVKIVDKDKFTAIGKANWKYITPLHRAEQTFRAAVKAAPENLLTALKVWEQKVLETEQDYVQTGQQTITIPKKHVDTQGNLALANRLISTIKSQLVQGVPVKEIVKRYFARELVTEAITEGGNALRYANSQVPKEMAMPTAKKSLELAGLETVGFSLVGNINRPMLNDIDIAVEQDELLTVLGGKPGDDVWKKLSEHLGKFSGLDYKINKGLRVFHVLTPLTDKQGNHQQVTSIETGKQSEQEQQLLGWVQVDVFVGSRTWLNKTMSGASVGSSYKAVYRNLFLWAIYKATDNLSFDVRQGVMDRTTKQPVTTSVDEMAKQLFYESDWNDIASFELLWQAFSSSKFSFPNLRDKVVELFRQALKQQKMSEPKEVIGFNSQQALVESSVTTEDKPMIIGLLPGAFKPPHKGHWNGFIKAAQETDKTVVFASTMGREDISFTGVLEVWDKWLIPELPINVDVKFVGQPTTEMLNVLLAAAQDVGNNNNYVMYGGGEDKERYMRFVRIKGIDKLTAQGRLQFKELPRLSSGTTVRELLRTGNFDGFKKQLPPPLVPYAKQVFELLKPI